MDNTTLQSCAHEYGTPLYVYDFDDITKRFSEFKDSFKARKSLICYALKANSNLSIINHLAKLGCGADCVSIGEVKRALAAGVEKYKVIFSGVGKRDDEIAQALELDILFLNVESEAELAHIESIAKQCGKVARISVRVNPNIDAKTHPYISTGLHENKFGVDIQSAKKMYIMAKNSPHLEPIGIHFHIGSQLLELEPILQGAQKIAELLHSLLALKVDIKFFDIGGGVGITYKDEQEIALYDYAQGILGILRGLDVTIICEPGRYIVGKSGVLLSKVLYEKHNGKKRFIIVDAAMNDLMRPALYDAYHRVEIITKTQDKKTPNTDSQAQDCKADIVGAICESSDFLAKDITIEALNTGDLISFANAGAYGYSMSSNYNTRLRPAEIGFKGGKTFIIKHRESFENLIADELELLKRNTNAR